MAEIKTLPRTNTTVLPGYVLREYSIASMRLAEQYLEGSLLESVGKAALKLKGAVAEMAIEKAMNVIASGVLGWGMQAFRMRVVSGSYTPFFLWLSLSEIRPDLKQEDAAALVTPENNEAITRALISLMFGDPVPNGEPAAARPAPPTSDAANTTAGLTNEATGPNPSPTTT